VEAGGTVGSEGIRREIRRNGRNVTIRSGSARRRLLERKVGRFRTILTADSPGRRSRNESVKPVGVARRGAGRREQGERADQNDAISIFTQESSILRHSIAENANKGSIRAISEIRGQ